MQMFRFLHASKCPVESTTWRQIILISFWITQNIMDDVCLTTNDFVTLWSEMYDDKISAAAIVNMECEAFKVLQFRVQIFPVQFQKVSEMLRNLYDKTILQHGCQSLAIEASWFYHAVDASWYIRLIKEATRRL